jgi:hypothetical protein
MPEEVGFSLQFGCEVKFKGLKSATMLIVEYLNAKDTKGAKENAKRKSV